MSAADLLLTILHVSDLHIGGIDPITGDARLTCSRPDSWFQERSDRGTLQLKVEKLGLDKGAIDNQTNQLVWVQEASLVIGHKTGDTDEVPTPVVSRHQQIAGI